VAPGYHRRRHWIWETYLERSEQRNDWRAAPLLADLAGLPKARLVVRRLDPLVDDSQRLAARLKEAAVQRNQCET
jgi:acetyl esterase